MSEENDRVDVQAWRVPAPPDGLVDRVMSTLGEDTRVAHLPSQPVEASPGRRGIPPIAVVAAAVLGAAAAAAAVVVVYEGSREPRDRGGSPAATRPAPAPAKHATSPAKTRDLPTSPRKLPSQAAREQLLEDIVRARIERERAGAAVSGTAGGGGGFAGGGGGAMSDPSAMDPEEIRNSVRDVLPLLAECYGQMSPSTQAAGGTLVAEMTVTGEPDVGTLIQDVTLVEGDAVLLDQVDFGECVKQTLLAVELPPLAAGGKVTIRYPFAFALSEDASPADDLAEQATEAARDKRYREGLELVQQALALDPEHEQALMTGAICACNLKERDLAVTYIAELGGGRAGMARQICLRNGVTL